MNTHMAKKIKIVLIITIFCLIFDIMTVYAAEVIFDADAVKEKTASKSSLMDVNGIFVFRDEFIEQERLVKQEQKEALETIETLVLLSPRKEFDSDMWVNLVLQADTEKYLKDIYTEKRENNFRWWVYCGTAAVCVLCIAIWIEDTRKKKKEDTKGASVEDERYRDF